MGKYNPKAPQDLGQEWVPIRSEGVVFSPSVNVVEQGHTFLLSTSRTLQDGRFYIKSLPPGATSNQVYMMSVYAAGKEAESGPIRSVIIPCNSVATTGAGFSGATVANLASPGDENTLSAQPDTDVNSKAVNLFFATSQYQNLLVGKRILAVNLLYQLTWDPINSGVPGDVATRQVVYSSSQNLRLETGTGSVTSVSYAPLIGTYGSSLLGLDPIIGPVGASTEIQRLQLGEINHLWQTPSTTQTQERMPWRYDELARFEATAGTNRYRIHFDFGGTASFAGIYYLGYAALEVIFCEENRLAIGGFLYNAASSYRYGANILTMRDLALAANPVLAAGVYTVVVSSPDIGDIQGPFAAGDVQRKAEANTYPTLNAVRQLDAIQNLKGVQVNLTQNLDDTFTSEEIDVLPQLSLHTSSGPLTEVHVYGEQARAQVYGTITATQEIFDGAAGGSGSYPWVRFYARRFGNTTVPLRLDNPAVTGTGTFVEITPAEFDALDEIVDGWKEVTLRFTTSPTMGAGTNPQFRWSATSELIGNRWEVLGAYAPAISGIPGNNLNTVPSPHQLSLATYGAAVSGANINLGWVPQYAPPVTATTDDQTADAMLLFAKDMQTITGFGSSNQDQTITGIGLNCGLNPCCVPSTLKYTRLTWSLPVNTGYSVDDFNRTVAANSWGTSSGGEAWSPSSTTGVTYTVDGSQGQITATVTNTRLTRLTPGGPDQDVRATLTLGTSVISGSYGIGVILRMTDSSNYYHARIIYTTTGAELYISRTVAGVVTDIVSMVVPDMLPSTTAKRKLRGMVVGNRLLAKVWSDTEPEPDWMLDATDNTFTTGNVSGIVYQNLGGNSSVSYSVDNFSVQPPDIYFGYYEMQRMDTVETTWQTIMQASSPLTTGFNDYEARVGIQSSYRIRAVDVHGFEGPWSSTVTATVPSPGVTIGCSDGHLLIFTSNEEQDGSINLAYSSVWEGRQVEEGFVFPESQFVQLQAMYNRDFFTAFRPTERGGEQFSRTVLVQAAAISPETLADFTSLRDMAWASTSYICVRDEDGNRWFATVLVPNGKVLRDRRLYMATVDIIEVTDTPSPVDPS